MGDPEFFGIAQGNSVRLRVPMFLNDEIGPVPITVYIEGNEMRFGPINVPVGSGRGEVAGWFLFDRWIPDTFSLDISVDESASVPVAFDILGVIANGYASGALNLAMEDRIFRATGNLTGRNTEIALNTGEIASRNREVVTTIPVIVDIAITSGNKVEFLWPSSDFPILRAYADVGTGIQIASDSVAGSYSVIGDVALRSGEIYYFQRSFYIRQGVLSFNENEIQFDPRITLRAETRDRTDTGPVTISMLADNAPLLSFNARVESSPPLSQMEISALLGQNITGVSGDNAVQAAFLASTADIFIQFGLIRRMERVIRDFLRLDMFSFRTQILQNAVMSLWSPVDRVGLVGNYFDNTTVFLGKYIGSNIFGQGMLLLRYDEDNQPLGGLNRTNRGLSIGDYTIELDFGIEMHSPLFDVRWSISPLHVENMFIDDMSFSVLWRWTF